MPQYAEALRGTPELVLQSRSVWCVRTSEPSVSSKINHVDSSDSLACARKLSRLLPRNTCALPLASCGRALQLQPCASSRARLVHASRTGASQGRTLSNEVNWLRAVTNEGSKFAQGGGDEHKLAILHVRDQQIPAAHCDRCTQSCQLCRARPSRACRNRHIRESLQPPQCLPQACQVPSEH